jgi:hypothetical protein
VVLEVGLDKENYGGYASYMMKDNSRINGVKLMFLDRERMNLSTFPTTFQK